MDLGLDGQGRGRHRREQGHRARRRRRRSPRRARCVVAGARTHATPRRRWPASPRSRSTSRRPTGRRSSSSARVDEHGRVDVLVNNVGAVRLRLDGFLGTSDEEFEWAMQMNFFTALRATRAALPAHGRAGRRARSSTSRRSTRSSSPTPARSTTAPPRPRCVNLSKSLAQEFGPQRHPRQLRLARPGQHRPVARRGRRRRDRRQGHRRRRRHGPREGRREHRRVRHRPLHDAGGGRHARRRCSPRERTGNVTGANYVIDGGLIKTI